MDPTLCPWDESVVFSSDRCPGGEEGYRNLFRLDLETGEISYLTQGRWIDSAPVWDPDTRGIYFTSDRDRFSAVYWVDGRGEGRRLTHSLDGLFDPRPVPGEDAFLATVFREGTFQVHRFAVPDSSGPAIALQPATAEPPWHWNDTHPEVASRRQSYRTRFALDVAQGGALVDPSLRTGEGVQAVLSDLMGNHLLYFNLANSTFSTDSFLRNFSFAGTYVNLTRRLNYGLSAFHYSGDFYDNLAFPYFEQRSGASVLLSYPLSKFRRIETSLSLAYAETDRPSIDFRRKGAIGTHLVSYVQDNTLWLPTGPIDGRRFNLTAGLTMNLGQGKEENTVLIGDYRHYFRIGQYSAYALRFQGRWSEGANPEFFWIGGSAGMRTYDRRQISGKRTLMLNQEVRFPLIRGLIFGLPMGNLELPGVEGAWFLDAGSAWDEGWPPPWYGSYGFGLRMSFGGVLVMRLDIGRQTDFEKLGSDTHTRFFIGWDY
ncbi:MAG: BamA/TamA family outer membrane protein [Candidatus Eisenbacteria bacterium]|uniref:BamA/TamA family outer membrane protein n=1 Tax=Eiseniibacteriota bacterium TaxID=2212470 RepID=A0A956LVH2_UNCEI|nr:BamA/TamA family outer membrane protein [Candidatus Eisenbacteria bacterium]